LVPCGPRDEERVDDPRELLLVRARDDVDRGTVAMGSRYPRLPTPPGSDTRSKALDCVRHPIGRAFAHGRPIG
jgi:hypothetical protein